MQTITFSRITPLRMAGPALRRARSHLWLLAAMLTAALPALRAQEADSFTPLSVSLLTVHPGNIIYELDGHTMLRLVTPQGDFCVNWGVFDFTEDDFIYRFVKGETDYMAVAYPTPLALQEYRHSGRRVTEQVLALDSAERDRVMMLVAHNLLPANARYRYNYVKDNCATRPLGIVEQAVGAPFILPDSVGAGTTYRSLMRRFHRNYPWYQFGIDLALGSGLDHQLTARETTFEPLLLEHLLSRAKRPDGTPAVAATGLIVSGSEGGIPDGPTPWWLTPLAVCTLLGAAALAWLARGLARRGAPPRLLVSLTFGLAFIPGLLLTFLIFVSTHEATSPNWLYLWLNPLCLFPAVAVWLKNRNKRLRAFYIVYHFANFAAVLTLGVLGLAGVQCLNSAFVPLMVLDAAISASAVITRR